MKKLTKIKTSAPSLPISKAPKPSRVNPFATYNGTWQKTRLLFLAKNPLCNFCKKRGMVEPATVVDHIEPHRGNPALFWDEGNWQALCKHCHDSLKQRMEKSS